MVTGGLNEETVARLMARSCCSLVSCKEKVKPGSVEVKRATVTGVTLAAVSLQEVDSYYETRARSGQER